LFFYQITFSDLQQHKDPQHPANHMYGTYREGLNVPFYRTLLRNPFSLACGGLKFGGVSVTWNRN